MARLSPPDGSSSQSSSSGTSSDKENRQRSSRGQKRGQPQTTSSRSYTKRQRLANRASNIQASQSQMPLSQQDRDKLLYDPDQDEKERRLIRKGLRDLTRDLHDSRSEFMQPGNHGIQDTIEKANEYFRGIKQTSDATLDSRLLVSAADLSYKKTAQLVLGGATAGLDVDEFVSKCMSFMRNGPEESQATQQASSTQRRRTQGRSQADPNDSDEDEGDPLNWDWLGRAACLRHNARPSVSGFLLGPLSVQKRTRQLTQRRARERIDPSQAVRPQELEERDLDRQETSNLTTMCASINKLLVQVQNRGQDDTETRLREIGDPTPEQIQETMDQNNVADDGGVPLFRFCINPKSFAQSVENLFYVSFLVRDGTVGLSVDSRQLPTLQYAKPYNTSEAQKKGIQKHQAVFSLDFDVWKDLIEVFDIKKSIIPHRAEEQTQSTGHGWYG